MLLYGAVVTIFIFLIMPVAIIIPMSFNASQLFEFPPTGFSWQWYQSFFSRPDWREPLLLSLRVAFLVSMFSMILGTLTAVGLNRSKFRGIGAIQGFILSPIIVPPIIVAVAVYFLFAKLRIVGSEVGLILAHGVLATPFVVVSVSATLKGFDQNIEQAAVNLGANRFQAFFYITLPIIRSGVISGAILSFIISFDELIIAIFISGSTAVTLPKKMWESIRIETDPTVAAVSSFLIGLSVIILVLIEMLRSWSEKRAEIRSTI